MKRRNVFSKVGQKKFPEADKLNKEDFPSFSRTIYDEVKAVLNTGSVGNTFYVNAEKNIEDMLEVLKKCDDTNWLAAQVVEAREQGYMRTMPIAGLVEVSKRDPRLFKEIASSVCRNPKDWEKFIDIARSKLLRDGCGRAIKKELFKEIKRMKTYHAIKYPHAVEDMINICRPNPIINRTVIDYIKKGQHYLSDRQMSALAVLKESSSEGDMINAISRGRLPMEVVTGSVEQMTPMIWEALLYQAPYMNLIRNLNNFGRNGVFSGDRDEIYPENLQYAYEQITKPENIANSRLFPMRFYVAHEMLMDFEGSDRLRNALDIAIEKSVENIPRISGDICIAPDVSGSMSGGSLTSDYSVLEPIDVVGVFTGMLIRKCREIPLLLPFNHEIQTRMADVASNSETVIDIAKAFRAGGGTSLSAPVEKLLDENLSVDHIIGITDNEEWYGEAFIDVFMEYKREVAPECKAHLVTLQPYRDFPTPPEFPDVQYIFGWSDNALRYLIDSIKD